jgi:hypothetical protein
MYIKGLFGLGVEGYLVKEEILSTIVEAIRGVVQGEIGVGQSSGSGSVVHLGPKWTANSNTVKPARTGSLEVGCRWSDQ